MPEPPFETSRADDCASAAFYDLASPFYLSLRQPHEHFPNMQFRANRLNREISNAVKLKTSARMSRIHGLIGNPKQQTASMATGMATAAINTTGPEPPRIHAIGSQVNGAKMIPRIFSHIGHREAVDEFCK
jgi:hypothetical protein